MAAILEQLPDLDQDTLRQVMARASYLLDPTGTGTPGAAPAAADADQSLIGVELAGVLKEAGERHPMPVNVILRSKVGPAFRAGVAALADYARANFKPAERVEMIKAVRTLLRLMAREINDRGLPVTAKTLSERMARVAQVVERQFPGYLQSGLLPQVLRMGKRTPSYED